MSYVAHDHQSPESNYERPAPKAAGADGQIAPRFGRGIAAALERMSSYKDALALDRHSPPSRVARAAELLERCEGIVLVEGLVALRPTAAAIRCEVIDPTPAAHRCEEEYRVLVENAARCLEKSALRELLPNRPLRWVVVDESGTRTVEWGQTL